MEDLTEAFLLLARESDDALTLETVNVNDILHEEVERAELFNRVKKLPISVSEQSRLVLVHHHRIFPAAYFHNRPATRGDQLLSVPITSQNGVSIFRHPNYVLLTIPNRMTNALIVLYASGLPPRPRRLKAGNLRPPIGDFKQIH